MTFRNCLVVERVDAETSALQAVRMEASARTIFMLMAEEMLSKGAPPGRLTLCHYDAEGNVTEIAEMHLKRKLEKSDP